MRRTALAVLAALVLAAPAHAGAWSRWDDFRSAVVTWRADSTQVARVHSLLLERDACTLALEDGRIALAVPLGGRRVAAVFTGHATLSVVPPTEFERRQLARVYGTPTLRKAVRNVVVIFADSTLAELRSALAFAPDTLGQLAPAWRGLLPYLAVKRTAEVGPPAVAHMLLDGADDGLFFAQATDARTGEPYFVTLDPNRTERFTLGRRPDADRKGLIELYDIEPVCRFFAHGDPDTLRRDESPPYDVTHVALDVDLATSFDLAATGAYDVVARRASREWFAFALPAPLRIEAASSPGRACTYHQEALSEAVWVHVDPPVPVDSAATLSLRWRGRAFDADADGRVTGALAWYPRPDVEARATWDVTVRHPRAFTVVGAGGRVAETEADGRVTSRWRIATPAPATVFAIGPFRGIRVTGDSLPPVTVWSERPGSGGEPVSLDLDRDPSPGGHDERIAADVAREAEFCRRAFGEPAAPGIEAVEWTDAAAPVCPGFVRLEPERERALRGALGAPDRARAETVARQWWGLGVAPATDHDRWLADGLAAFTSIWYLQAGRRDPRTYLDQLATWRREIVEDHHFAIGGHEAAGPPWLGLRLESSRTPGDLDLVLRRKGAWVIHMLRGYLLRDDDPEEKRFRGLLHDFYARFSGGHAFTEDFRAAAEAAAGEDLGWFFGEWVYGDALPTYRFRWSVKAEGGAWRVHGRVEQSGVPESFRMPVAVRVTFPDGGFAREKVWVRGAVTEFDLPLSPKKPADVVFDDLESVLGEVVK